MKYLNYLEPGVSTSRCRYFVEGPDKEGMAAYYYCKFCCCMYEIEPMCCVFGLFLDYRMDPSFTCCKNENQ